MKILGLAQFLPLGDDIERVVPRAAHTLVKLIPEAST